MKRTPLARVSAKTAQQLAEPGYRAFTAPRFGRCAVCRKPGLLRRHHVVTERHVRADGGDPWDIRNSMMVGDHRVCGCHRAHHDAVRRIPVSKIPAHAIEFAIELMGAARTDDYLDRYYAAG